MLDQLIQLRQLAMGHLAGRGATASIAGIRIHRAEAPTTPANGVYEPTICIVLQGAKTVMIGDQTLRYDPASCFIASVELPATGCISEASVEEPYLGVSMAIDLKLLSSMLIDMAPGSSRPATSFFVSPVTPELLDTLRRILELLHKPEDVPMLGPLLRQEILYRLLQSEQGTTLRQLAHADSRLSQVHRAIGWIRSNFKAPLNVNTLAAVAGMSKASLHRHFRAATAMSPLQYQKTLRLQEAKRLLVTHGDAQRTAYSVGYLSPSQFTREYSRMFGISPGRDAARLRQLT